MRYAIPTILFAGVLVGALCGCGNGSSGNGLQNGTHLCTDSYQFGLHITLKVPVGQTAGGTQVTVQEGSYQEAYTAAAGQAATFNAAGERPGNYLITATHPTLGTITRNANVGSDGCHAITQQVMLDYSQP